MQGFHIVKFREGEKIIFGPVRTAHRSALKVNRESHEGEVTHTSFRRVCITDQRVILESGDSVITIPNIDIKKVIIKRKSKKKSAAIFDLVAVTSKSGLRVKVEINEINSARETELSAAFPKAQIKENKGLTGFIDKLFGD